MKRLNKLNQTGRSGFTLVGLLVVVGSICVLFAILLPAVVQVQNAAKQATCMNNIRQLVLSLHNYESAHRELPRPTGIGRTEQNKLPKTTDRYSGLLSILNFMSRYSGPYYDEAHEVDGATIPAFPDVDAVGHPLWSQQQHGFLCPSLPVVVSEYGATHYAFSIGDVGRNVHSPKVIRGAFAVGLEQQFENFIDGSSNTIMMAEIGGFSERSAGRRYAVNQSTKFLNNPSLTLNLIDGSRRYKSSVELGRISRGGNWANGTGGPGLVNTILPPGSPSVLVGGAADVDGLFSASTNHSGGSVVAMGDGSAHLIMADIDVGDQTHPTASAEDLAQTESHYGVWGALGSANGAESVARDYLNEVSLSNDR